VWRGVSGGDCEVSGGDCGVSGPLLPSDSNRLYSVILTQRPRIIGWSIFSAYWSEHSLLGTIEGVVSTRRGAPTAFVGCGRAVSSHRVPLQEQLARASGAQDVSI